MDEGRVLLTTQPGWSFATLAELRRLGAFHGRADLHHRDSTLGFRAASLEAMTGLNTPAEVFGEVASAGATRSADATTRVIEMLRPSVVKQGVLRWLPLVEGTSARRYSVGSETFGRTRARRADVDSAIEGCMRAAFSAWRRVGRRGVRIVCKGDPKFAFVGVQLSTNLGQDDSGRAGALRRHLACGLLEAVGVGAGSHALDPFMGAGTILEAALNRYGARSATGYEVDAEALALARRRLAGQGARIVEGSFEEIDLSLVDADTRIATNAPFGERFQRVDTARLIRTLARCLDRGARVSMLASREQGREIAAALRLRRRNVIVLGQPASIVHTP